MTSVNVKQSGTDKPVSIFVHFLVGTILITPSSGILIITPQNARKLARILLQMAERVDK